MHITPGCETGFFVPLWFIKINKSYNHINVISPSLMLDIYSTSIENASTESAPM